MWCAKQLAEVTNSWTRLSVTPDDQGNSSADSDVLQTGKITQIKTHISCITTEHNGAGSQLCAAVCSNNYQISVQNIQGLREGKLVNCNTVCFSIGCFGSFYYIGPAGKDVYVKFSCGNFRSLHHSKERSCNKHD